MKSKLISAVSAVLVIITVAAPVTFGVFAVLRLTHAIDWSWWLVTSPLWGAALIILAVIIATVILMFAAFCIIRPKAVAEFKARKGGTL